jgi:cell shape-determining protein MreC
MKSLKLESALERDLRMARRYVEDRVDCYSRVAALRIMGTLLRRIDALEAQIASHTRAQVADVVLYAELRAENERLREELERMRDAAYP